MQNSTGNYILAYHIAYFKVSKNTLAVFMRIAYG